MITSISFNSLQRVCRSGRVECFISIIAVKVKSKQFIRWSFEGKLDINNEFLFGADLLSQPF